MQTRVFGKIVLVTKTKTVWPMIHEFSMQKNTFCILTPIKIIPIKNDHIHRDEQKDNQTLQTILLLGEEQSTTHLSFGNVLMVNGKAINLFVSEQKQRQELREFNKLKSPKAVFTYTHLNKSAIISIVFDKDNIQHIMCSKTTVKNKTTENNKNLNSCNVYKTKQTLPTNNIMLMRKFEEDEMCVVTRNNDTTATIHIFSVSNNEAPSLPFLHEKKSFQDMIKHENTYFMATKKHIYHLTSTSFCLEKKLKQVYEIERGDIVALASNNNTIYVFYKHNNTFHNKKLKFMSDGTIKEKS